MKRFTALVLIAAICLGSVVRAEPVRGGRGDRDYICDEFDALVGQLVAILHNPIGALLVGLDARLILYALNNPGAASSASAIASSIAGGAGYEPGDAGDTNWVFNVSETYRVVESDVAVRTLGTEGHIRSWRTDLDAHLVGDRWVLSINVPYRNWEGYGAYGELGGQSLALQVVPQYFVLQQDSELVDLSVFLIAGIEHNMFDGDPGIDDATYVTWGAGVQIAKTFDFGDISLGYTYQPWINIDGDAELDGSDTMNYHTAALTYTFGLGEGLYGSLGAIWKYAEDLPDQYDSDEYLGRAALGYATECWNIQAGFGRTLVSDDFSEWEAGLSMSFRW